MKPRKTSASQIGQAGKASPPKAPEIPPPRDVVDGIPDRSPHRPLWLFLLLGSLFLAWVIFLIYVGLSGKIQ